MRTSDKYISPMLSGVEKSVQYEGKKVAVTNRKKLFYLLLCLFVLGLMYGSVLLKTQENSLMKGISLIQKTAIGSKQNESFGTIFLSGLLSGGAFMLVTFLFGFSAISQPLTLATMFVKGLGLGSSVGFFYVNYGAAGIGYSVLMVFPGALLCTFALLLSARESVTLSNIIAGSFIRESSKCSSATIKLYLFKHFILFCFVVAAALLDGITAVIFSGIFKFS